MGIDERLQEMRGDCVGLEESLAQMRVAATSAVVGRLCSIAHTNAQQTRLWIEEAIGQQQFEDRQPKEPPI